MSAPVLKPEVLPRYVELIRVSTQGQKDRDTPEDQRRALDQLQQTRPGICIERIGLDQAVSGAKDTAARPDIQRLTVLAQDRKFDEVRVRHIDRLTRHENPAERFAVYSLIAAAGAVIVDAQGRVTDPKTELGEIDYYFQTLMAARERQRIRDRTIAAKRRKAGEHRLAQGQPPFGRRFDKATGQWSLDPVRAKTYRQMFDLRLAGHSLNEIADRLNRSGSVTPRGCEWSGASVAKLLHTPSAYGTYTTHRVTFSIPAIVDEATFRRAEAKLRANNSLSGPKPKVFALLRKLVVCGGCGAPMYLQLGGGTPARHRYYYCSKHDPACFLYHRVADVDAKVVEALRGWLEDPRILASAAGGQGPEEVRAEAQRDAAEAAADLKDLDSQEMKLARLARKGLISAKVTKLQLAEVAKSRTDAETRLADARARLDAAERVEADAADLTSAVEELRRGVEKATPERWRSLCEAVFARGDVRLHPSGKIEFTGRVQVGERLSNPSPSSGKR
jgi:site-specific DNA recombinase